MSEFLICFEAWAISKTLKLDQQWLDRASLGIHLEPISKPIDAVSDNTIIIN